MNKKIFIGIMVFVLVFIADFSYGQGCSQCKLLAEQSSEVVDESSFGTNINYGILYLMAVPYILLFLFFRKRIIRLFKALTNKD